jgi:ribosomal protein L12E/L44/L45/RPP1/RPP2
MIEHSSKSKGYLPMKSGPNMMGFDMGKSSSLMEMMQTGGQPSRGAAMLAQATQRQSDIKKLEDQQRAEAKRQKRGGLFGSIGGLAGGLLGSAALGALGVGTGGLGLALAAGLGTALGRRAGEGIGAGKTRKADTEGTVFAQQAFRDVEQASRDYTRGMGERAIVSGLKAGLSAGLTPGGGIYGKAKSFGIRNMPRQAFQRVAPVATDVQNIVSTPMSADLPSAISGTEEAYLQSLSAMDASNVDSLSGLIGGAQDSAQAFANRPQGLEFLGDSAMGVPLEPITFAGSSGVDASDTNLLGLLYRSQQGPSESGVGYNRGALLNELLSASPYQTNVVAGMEDGGLIEYQYGGGVSDIQQILQDAGIQANENQLALFQQFDPSSLNELASNLQSSLLSGTQQAQQQQAGMGFAGSGAIQQAQEQQRESVMGQFESAQDRAARGFESQTLGDAASMIGQGAEFSGFTAPPPTVSTLPTLDQGDVTYNGTEYVWDSETGRYITRDQYEQGLADEQSDQD